MTGSKMITGSSSTFMRRRESGFRHSPGMRARRQFKFLRMRALASGFIEVTPKSSLKEEWKSWRRVTLDIDTLRGVPLLLALNVLRLLGARVYEVGFSSGGRGYHVKCLVPSDRKVEYVRRLARDDTTRLYLDYALRPGFIRQVLFDRKRRLK